MSHPNGLMQMVMGMVTTNWAIIQMLSPMIQHNGPTMMVMDMETILTAPLQIHVRILQELAFGTSMDVLITMVMVGPMPAMISSRILHNGQIWTAMDMVTIHKEIIRMRLFMTPHNGQI